MQWGPGPRQEQISRWDPQHDQKLLERLLQGKRLLQAAPGLLPTALHEGLLLVTLVLRLDALKHFGLLLSVLKHIGLLIASLKRGEPLLGALGREWLPRKSAHFASHTASRTPLQQHQHG